MYYFVYECSLKSENGALDGEFICDLSEHQCEADCLKEIYLNKTAVLCWFNGIASSPGHERELK